MTRTTVLIFGLSLLLNLAHAQIPRTLSYQGVLSDSAGTPKPDGMYQFTFRLYTGSSGGSALWSEIQAAPTHHGLFAAVLGSVTPIPESVQFDQQYWLGIQVGSEPELSPRLQLSSVAYSLHSVIADSARYAQGTIPAAPLALSATVNSPNSVLAATVSSGNGLAIKGTSVSFVGVWGESQTGQGVVGYSTSSTGSGVYGWNDNAGSSGVLGRGNNGKGVWGTSTTGVGVYGSSSLYAVQGVTGGSTGSAGVRGEATATTNDVRGVFGLSSSTTGNGVVGEALASTGTGRGVWGVSHSRDGIGLYGSNTDPAGWAGYFTGNVGIGPVVTADARLHVNGGNEVGAGVGIHGSSNDNYGVHGSSNGSFGVYGESGTSSGIRARTYNGSNFALFSDYSTNGTNFCGLSSGYYALYANGLTHIEGNGECSGDMEVTGTLSVDNDFYCYGSINPRIDHPLDPANKTLAHACIESNEQLLMYRGSIVTDGNGDATVILPPYFEALNINYQYQLTVVSHEFAKARVESEIAGNQFSIKTDKPNIKICWVVTGDRNDAYSRAHPFEVEQQKKPEERGKFLSPELFGQPESMRIGYRPPPQKPNIDIHSRTSEQQRKGTP